MICWVPCCYAIVHILGKGLNAPTCTTGLLHLFISEYDECATDKHGCDHVCVNTLGSFKCECKIGYELHSDGKKCEGLKDVLRHFFTTTSNLTLT